MRFAPVHMLLTSSPRWTRTRRITAAAIAATIPLAAVAAVSAPAQAEPAPAPSNTLKWRDCPAEFGAVAPQCAELKVPMDYAKPQGTKITITVSRIPATKPDKRRGVLFGNPGGPGGDGLSTFVNQPAPEGVAEEFDLIGVQPRGQVHATPVKCAPDDNIIATTFYNGANLRARCDRGTPKGFTQSITTANTARDANEVRKALGEKRINWMGTSYGTQLASTYATLFPANTDKVILDSAMNPDWAWNQTVDRQTSGYKKRVYAMMQWIADNNGQFKLGTTPLQVYQRWAAQVSREAGVPPTLTAPPATIGDVPPGLKQMAQWYVDGANLTADARTRLAWFTAKLLNPGGDQRGSTLLGLTRMVAPSRPGWMMVARSLMDGKTVDFQEGMSPERKKAAEVSANMQSLQMCNENNAPAQPSRIPEAVTSLFLIGDVFDLPGQYTASGLACGGGPAPRPLTPIANKGLATAPMLINSVDDPQTPYDGAMVMAKRMRAQVVTVSGGDHGQFGRENKPLDDAITEYLRSGRVTATKFPEAPLRRG